MMDFWSLFAFWFFPYLPAYSEAPFFPSSLHTIRIKFCSNNLIASMLFDIFFYQSGLLWQIHCETTNLDLVCELQRIYSSFFFSKFWLGLHTLSSSEFRQTESASSHFVSILITHNSPNLMESLNLTRTISKLRSILLRLDLCGVWNTVIVRWCWLDERQKVIIATVKRLNSSYQKKRRKKTLNCGGDIISLASVATVSWFCLIWYDSDKCVADNDLTF